MGNKGIIGMQPPDEFTQRMSLIHLACAGPILQKTTTKVPFIKNSIDKML